MATEADLHNELISLYRRTGEAIGYWAHYFLREVRRHGGLAVARRLLDATRASAGFDRLATIRRADLSVEAIALTDRFGHLFSAEERQVAELRLATRPSVAFPTRDIANPDHPTDIVEGCYPEGAVQRVLVNRYERSAKAELRAFVVSAHSAPSAICDLLIVTVK